jgi:hypothetical protein
MACHPCVVSSVIIEEPGKDTVKAFGVVAEEQRVV